MWRISTWTRAHLRKWNPWKLDIVIPKCSWICSNVLPLLRTTPDIPPKILQHEDLLLGIMGQWGGIVSHNQCMLSMSHFLVVHLLIPSPTGRICSRTSPSAFDLPYRTKKSINTLGALESNKSIQTYWECELLWAINETQKPNNFTKCQVGIVTSQVITLLWSQQPVPKDAFQVVLVLDFSNDAEIELWDGPSTPVCHPVPHLHKFGIDQREEYGSWHHCPEVSICSRSKKVNPWELLVSKTLQAIKEKKQKNIQANIAGQYWWKCDNLLKFTINWTHLLLNRSNHCERKSRMPSGIVVVWCCLASFFDWVMKLCFILFWSRRVQFLYLLRSLSFFFCCRLRYLAGARNRMLMLLCHVPTCASFYRSGIRHCPGNSSFALLRDIITCYDTSLCHMPSLEFVNLSEKKRKLSTDITTKFLFGSYNRAIYSEENSCKLPLANPTTSGRQTKVTMKLFLKGNMLRGQGLTACLINSNNYFMITLHPEPAPHLQSHCRILIF